MNLKFEYSNFKRPNSRSRAPETRTRKPELRFARNCAWIVPNRSVCMDLHGIKTAWKNSSGVSRRPDEFFPAALRLIHTYGAVLNNPESVSCQTVCAMQGARRALRQTENTDDDRQVASRLRRNGSLPIGIHYTSIAFLTSRHHRNGSTPIGSLHQRPILHVSAGRTVQRRPASH